MMSHLPDNHLIAAVCVGSKGAEILSKDQEAAVMGKTSRGVFFKTGNGWALFAGAERYNGPITITFEEANPNPAQFFDKLSPGDRALIHGGQIIIPGAGVVISTAGSRVWKPENPSLNPWPHNKRDARIKTAIAQILTQKRAAEFEVLLSWLPVWPLPEQAPMPDLTATRPGLEVVAKLQSTLREGDIYGIANTLENFLGIGAGLTPYGDDFVLGILLALNRWKDVVMPGATLQFINRQVVEAARHTTTTLSASLIACAAQGLANERLIDMLDWLMSETFHESPPADALLGWGASSGVAAFIGFVTALH